LNIKNTGSTNVSNIEAELNTTQVEATNPLLTPQPSNYASGGFLVLHNSSESVYYYVGRLEWNDTTKPADLLNEQANTVSWGFHRNVSSNYLWTLSNGTDGKCNETGSLLKIKTLADTGSNRDMGSNYADITGLTPGVDWASGTFASGPLDNQCVALYTDCTRFYIYKNDYSDEFPACSDRSYLQTSDLSPDNTHVAKVRVFVPSGIPSGATSNTVLTITATSV
jgi:hypothetical protein